MMLDGQVGVAAGALTRDRSAEVVDHDRGAVLRQLHGVAAADAVARAGDDRHLAVEQPHGCTASSVSVSDGPSRL